jgi:hypothetical protein
MMIRPTNIAVIARVAGHLTMCPGMVRHLPF